ncbi:hypothetical protein CC86DRAFT_364732 [Ophiobolus disseminans]|uniref:Uncharacterized protein n=1 Tax=Ophiobolus disseminans TaxID=1469910 RepID=A0A6A6ZAP4_9PLEO|nr:hypothetical protein CC86DRAFT_364732 [Ophiobolus disseminans]
MNEEIHQKALSEQGQPSTRGYGTPHQACCAQVVLQTNNLYHYTRSQLENTHNQVQLTKYHAQKEVHASQVELQKEREAHELANQRYAELKERHSTLEERHACATTINYKLNEKLEQSQAFATRVSEKAEGLVNNFRTERGEVVEDQNGQSVKNMILESANNAWLVAALSGQFSEEHLYARLNLVMAQNTEFEKRNTKIEEQAAALATKVEEGEAEIASLKMALELTTADGTQRKQPKRARMKVPKGSSV